MPAKDKILKRLIQIGKRYQGLRFLMLAVIACVLAVYYGSRELKRIIGDKRMPRRFVAAMLCVMLVFTECAPAAYAATGEEAVCELIGGTIQSFEPLPGDVAYQLLEEGGSEAAIRFPDVLAANILVANSTEGAQGEIPSEDENKDEDEDVQESLNEVPEASEQPENASEETDQPEEEQGAPEQTQEPESAQGKAEQPERMPETMEETGQLVEETRQFLGASPVGQEEQSNFVTETQVIPVTWQLQGEHAFDASAGRMQNDYVYRAVLPEVYVLADGVSVPVIVVTITNSASDFSQSVTLGQINVSVSAPQGVFPENAILKVEKIGDVVSEDKIASAIESSMADQGQTVMVEETCSFDIKVLDAQGNELQPDTSKGEVTVRFCNIEAVNTADAEQSVEVFHVDDALENAQPVSSEVKEEQQTVEITAEHFSIYTIALTRTAEIAFANDGYPYGKNMSASSVTLVTELAEGTTETAANVQWYYSASENGNYTAVAGATALSYTFSPQVGNKYWYKCKVGSMETKAVQVVKASPYSNADIKPLKSQTRWYISNGTMAYTVWSGYQYFDVIGTYTKDGTEYWINTSYGTKWGTKNQNVDALRFSFDEKKEHLIKMEAKLKETESTYGIDADVMLADYSITGYCDSASLKAIYEGEKVDSVQMVGAASIDDAVETDPAFVLTYTTTPSSYWLGRYYSRAYNTYNIGTAGSYGVADTRIIGGQEVVTEVAGIDSGMSTTWDVEAGETVSFSFSIGSVAETGARIKATAAVKSDSVFLSDLDPTAEYRLIDENGNPVTDWLVPDDDGTLTIDNLKPDTKYTVQARPKGVTDESKIQNVSDLTTAIDPSDLETEEGEIGCEPTASSLTFSNLNHKYYYRLMLLSEGTEDEYTEATGWASPEEGKGLTFSRLAPNTTYYLEAKSATNEGSEKRPYTTNKAELKATAIRRAQVNLAVGSTSTDYSDFEQQLRNQLEGFYPENIKISAAAASDATSTTSFPWNKYDHTKNGKGSGQIIDVGNQSTNDYNDLDNHIVENTTYKTLDFYGYGSSAYKDFYINANDQTTRKEIEFNVTEGTAYDAFDGAGFLVNCSVSGAYTASSSNAQKLNGYLVFFQYNGSGKGQSMKVFQLTDVNTYALQQGLPNSFVFDNLSSVGATSTTYGTIKLIASATTTYGDYKFRKVHIKALPTYIQVWYSGGASTSAQSVDLTANNANRDNSYLVKWNVSDVSGVQNKIPITASYDNDKFRGGFGPLASYRSHNCKRLTHFTMSNVSLDMDVVRSMTDIIRQPDWDSNYDSYLVNLNEAQVADFSSDYSTSEIISRLIEDQVSYIGWGSDVNKVGSESFIEKLNIGGVRGTFVNKNGTTSTKESQIQAIANYIKENTPEKEAKDCTILAPGEDVPQKKNYLYMLDEDWQIDGLDTTLVDDNGWTITRSETGLDYTDSEGNLVVQSDKAVWASNASLDVEQLFKRQSGYYQIYRSLEYEKLRDQAPVYLQVHTNAPPVAGLTTSVSGTTCTVTSQASDDLSGFKDTITVKKVSNNEVVQTRTVENMPTTQSANVFSFMFGKNVTYMISQVITDSDGSTTIITQSFFVQENESAKPYNSFSVNATELLTKRDKLTITDQSRAADDSQVKCIYTLKDANGYYYTLENNAFVKNNKTVIIFAELDAQQSIGDIDLSNLESGTYTLSMTAQASKNGATPSGATDVVSKLLHITKGAKVTWNYNGSSLNGETSAEPSYVAAGAALTLPTELPEKEGTEFIGWSNGTQTYAAGAAVPVSGDVTLTAQFKDTMVLHLTSSWQYYYTTVNSENGAPIEIYDEAEEYPTTVTLQLRWRKQGATAWTNYTGRVEQFREPFVIEGDASQETELEGIGTVTISGLETSASDGTRYQYCVDRVSGDERKNYRVDVTGENEQTYITADSADEYLTVKNTFEPATFTTKIKADFSKLPDFITVQKDDIWIGLLAEHYRNAVDENGEAYGWSSVASQLQLIELNQTNSFETRGLLWCWENEQPGEIEKNTAYKNRVTLATDGAIVWNGGRELPNYISLEFNEQSYQHRAGVQEALTVTFVLNEEYMYYDPDQNKITLKKDVDLDEPLKIEEDTTIDLNGNDLNGPAGEPAVEVGGEDTTLTVTDPTGKGKIKGGDGAPADAGDKPGGSGQPGEGESGGGSGEDPGETGGEPPKGGDGGDGIRVTGNNKVRVEPGVTVEGGDGGDSENGAGGKGGNGISAENGDVENEGNVRGGNGGDSKSGTAGDGGNGINSEGGKITNTENGTAAGGNGGGSTSGTFGNGGSALYTETGEIDNQGKTAGGKKGTYLPTGSSSDIGNSSGTGGSSLKIPVSGDQNRTNVTAEVKGSTAVINNIDTSALQHVIGEDVKTGIVEIDLSGANQEINAVSLPVTAMKDIAKAANDKNNDVVGLGVQLTTARVELNDTALQAIVDQAEGSHITLVVDDNIVDRLSETQTSSIQNMDVRASCEAYFVSNGKRIGDFRGGNALVKIPYVIPKGHKEEDYSVWYIADDGSKTKFATSYDKKEKAITFRVNHFSDFVVVYEAKEEKIKMDTSFRKLRLRATKSTQTTSKMRWRKDTEADGYVIYGAPCNTKTKTYKFKKLAVIKNGTSTAYTNKKLKSGTYYKYYIKAYKLVNGKKVWLAKSKTIHVTTTGGKYDNAKSVKVNKTVVALKKGKTFKIQAVQITNGKPIQNHAKIMYESTNKKIASVNSKGVIKAKKKGTCYIYVYAQNGVYKRIRVTVK